MLPSEAKAYFDSLWSAQSADASISLARQRAEFEKAELAKGRRPNGAGYAARLSALYNEDLSQRAKAIAETLKKVHQSFNSPLDDGVDAQLLDWGARAISTAYQGLEVAYMQHLQRFGFQTIHASGLEHTYALAQATVANLPRRYLWELRNVPTMRPQQPAAPHATHVTINTDGGSVGVVQTGPGSSATVQQQWITGDTAALQSALDTLRVALQHAHGLEAETQQELVEDVDRARAELSEDKPNKGKLLRWLGGIGTVLGAVGSAQPAYEAVKALARALGIPLP